MHSYTLPVLLLLSLLALASAFLPPIPSSSSLVVGRRGQALASSSAGTCSVLLVPYSFSSSSSPPTQTHTQTTEELSRKEKSKEQVRSLLKGLGELDDDDKPSEGTGSKRKVSVPPTHPPTHLPTHPYTHSIYPSSHSYINPPTHPPTYLPQQEKKEGMEAARRALNNMDKTKLEPEAVFFEGPPHWSEVRPTHPPTHPLTHPPTHLTHPYSSSFEPPRSPLPSYKPTHPPTHPPTSPQVVVPAISILTVIGIIPFASSVARQIWVRPTHPPTHPPPPQSSQPMRIYLLPPTHPPLHLLLPTIE